MFSLGGYADAVPIASVVFVENRLVEFCASAHHFDLLPRSGRGVSADEHGFSHVVGDWVIAVPQDVLESVVGHAGVPCGSCPAS